VTDYQSFIHGGVQYPLPTGGTGIGGPGASLLRDADSSSFYMLEFFKSVLETHLRGRFMAEVASSGADQIASIVGETFPFNPEPFLVEHQFTWPLLAAYRKGSKFTYIGSRKLSVDHFEVAYVLPPMQAGEAERLLPILKSVVNVLDSCTERGFDPSYTPSAPMGTAGDSAWVRAGVARAEVTSVSYGGYAPTDKLFFPAVLITLELEERNEAALSDFGLLDGADVAVDIKDSVQQTTVLDVADFATWPAPTLTSLSPTTGTKAGGTTVTLTGTNFRVGTLPKVTFGGIAATSVNVVSATSITCKSPAHDAFDTFAADVVVTNIDGQSATLAASYTFTTP
jgi:hypothetical protein